MRLEGWAAGSTWEEVSSWEAIPDSHLNSAPACQRVWRKKGRCGERWVQVVTTTQFTVAIWQRGGVSILICNRKRFREFNTEPDYCTACSPSFAEAKDENEEKNDIVDSTLDIYHVCNIPSFRHVLRLSLI